MPGTGGDGGSDDLCGNEIAEEGEDCDGADLRGFTCIDLDFDGGDLGCRSDCTWDTSACTRIEICDDGIDNDGDGDVDCDDSDCFDDIEACPRCGDGVINGDDACDGEAIPTTCETEGFSHGTIGCTDSCELDLSGCVAFEICDDGIDNDGDGDIDCDDSDCFDDTEACPRCGDGVINGDDTCDGEAIPTTCEEEGFSHGTIVCTDACELDTSGCVPLEICDDGIDNDGNGDTDCDDAACLGVFECPVCGDDTVQQGEECDGDAPMAATCATFGFNAGDLGCNGCMYDVTACHNVEICTNGVDDNGDGLIDCADPECDQVAPCPVCGNGLVEGDEECDDNNLNDDDGCSSSCEIEPWLVRPTIGDVSQTFGELDAGDPTFVRTMTCSGLTSLGSMHYEVHWLENPHPGAADVSVTANWSGDGYLFAYAPTFDPIDAETNCLVGHDGSGTTSTITVTVPGNSGVWIVATEFAQGDALGAYTLAAETLTICGDSVVSGAEQCDFGDHVDGDGCSSSCQLESGWNCDATTCWQTVCGDGVQEGDEECDDNNTVDGDGCSSTCLLEGASCAAPLVLNNFPGTDANTWSFQGTTVDRPSNFNSLCAASSLSPDVFVSFTAPVAGTYSFYWDTPTDGNISLLDDTCAPVADACYDTNWIAGPEGFGLELQAAEEVVFVLDSWEGASPIEGPFTLSAWIRVCGNGTVEPGEQCDDSNLLDGDGCSSACQLEPTFEVEPNDDLTTATPFVDLGRGGIPTFSDVDVWSFQATAGTTYTIFTAGFPDGGCGPVDTYMEVYDSAGNLLGSNEDMASGEWCSEFTFTAAATETIYVWVEIGFWYGWIYGLIVPDYWLFVTTN